MVKLDLGITVEGSYELRDKDGNLKQTGTISDSGLDKLAEMIEDGDLELEGNE